jgi:hypothetical protein
MLQLVGMIVALVVLAAPLVGEAPPAGKVYRIGFLGNGNPTTTTSSEPALDTFRQGLRELCTARWA